MSISTSLDISGISKANTTVFPVGSKSKPPEPSSPSALSAFPSIALARLISSEINPIARDVSERDLILEVSV